MLAIVYHQQIKIKNTFMFNWIDEGVQPYLRDGKLHGD
jgi:hypothetical protein